MARLLIQSALATAVVASLSTTALAACDFPPVPRPAAPLQPGAPAPAPVNFFADIQPSDGVLDVWCRLQAALPKGKYQMKVIFLADKRGFMDKDFKAERVFDVAFDPASPAKREDLARLLQSLLPLDPNAKASDEKGQAFPAALERTVQGASPQTPDGQSLGVPRKFAQSRTLALWVSMQIKIRPIKVYGQDFYLSVTFRPSVGRLMMATMGQAEQLVLRAATNRVLPYKNFMNCPEFVPDCKGYDTPTVELQTAWLVDKVGLASEGATGLSGITKTLAEGMIAKNPKDVALNSMGQFSIPDGAAHVQIKDETRELEIVAEGDPEKASGTRSIKLLWQERQGSDKSFYSGLSTWTKQVRDRMVLDQGPLAPTP